MKIDIQKLCKKNKYTLILLAISIIIQTLISSIFPYLTKFIIDDILIKKTLHTLNKLSILIVFLIILNLSFNVLISYLCSKWTQDVIFSLRQEISQFFFNRIDTPKKNGLFINSILSDCELVGSQLLNILLNGLPNILLTVIYLIILLSLNKFLVLITFFSFPLFFIISFVTSKKIFTLSKTLQSQKDTLLEYLNAHVRNKLLIYLYELIIEEQKKFNEQIKIIKKNTIHANTILSFLGTLSGVITIIIPLSTLLIGSYLVINDKMSIGTLITFNSYTTLIFSPLSKILTIPTNISQLNASIERIETNVLPTSFVHNGTFAKEKLEDDQIISIHNYLPFVENTALFTRPLSVCFKKGYIYRIIGKNGIGKSLFLQSIIQYYTNYSGNILVSKDSSISYVPQENFLFDGTIKDNLTKGLANYDEQDLYNFMNLFNCKLKLNQEVHSYSLKLSSGELQKIKLIRALLSKPDIILLDEVFANMDQTTIQTLIDYLLANNLTTIFIYHGELSSEIDNLNFQIINLNKYTDGE